MNENELRFCASKFPSFKNTNDNFPISNAWGSKVPVTKRRVIRFTENFVLKQANSVGKLFFTYFHRLVNTLVENEDYIGQKGEIGTRNKLK